VNAFVDADRLRFDWTYSASIHHASTVEDLGARFIDELNLLIEHCAQPDAGGFTPSDFPEAGLSQSELDRFLGGLA
jgi:non-ribosomal peptide synthase protein (TIGR01720 family)